MYKVTLGDSFIVRRSGDVLGRGVVHQGCVLYKGILSSTKARTAGTNTY